VFCVRSVAGNRKVTFLNTGLLGGKLSFTSGRKPLRYSFKSTCWELRVSQRASIEPTENVFKVIKTCTEIKGDDRSKQALAISNFVLRF